MGAASGCPARPSTGPDRHGGLGGWERWFVRAEAAAERLSSAAAAAKDRRGGGGETWLTATHDAREDGGEPSCTCHGMGEGWVSVGGLAAALRSGWMGGVAGTLRGDRAMRRAPHFPSMRRV